MRRRWRVWGIKEEVMRKTVSVQTLIIIGIVFIVGGLFVLYKLKTKPTPDYRNLELKGKIVNITKRYRGTYELTIDLGGGSIRTLNDYKFSAYSTNVSIGDSVFKEKGSQCFFYRKDHVVVARNCDSIQFEEGK